MSLPQLRKHENYLMIGQLQKKKEHVMIINITTKECHFEFYFHRQVNTTRSHAVKGSNKYPIVHAMATVCLLSLYITGLTGRL